MMRHGCFLVMAAAVLVPSVRAAAPPSATPSVALDATNAKVIDLQTARLKKTAFRATWNAYGEVISPSEVLGAARSLMHARASERAASATAQASTAEYQRLQGLFRQHANVARRQLESARAQQATDEAALQQARVSAALAQSDVQARWGPVITSWMTSTSSRLTHMTSGQGRLVRLTLPGRTRLQPPNDTIALVAVNDTQVSADWVSLAPTTAKGQEGVTFYAWADHGGQDLSYGTHVVGRVPHGKAMHGVIVPRAAAVWSGSSAWFFEQTDKDTYQRKPLSTGYPTAGGWFEPRQPDVGAVIVTRGAQVLLSMQEQAVAPPPTGDEND